MGQENCAGEEQTSKTSPGAESKAEKSKYGLRDWFENISIILVFGVSLGSWIWWINKSEQYDLTGISVPSDDPRGSYNGICDPVDFKCNVGDGITFITVPLAQISTRRRDDGKPFTSVLFSDTECENRDFNCLLLDCRHRLDGGRHRGESAEILVPTDEDLKIWSDYLERARDASSVKPVRVLPPGHSVKDQAESPTNK